MSARRKSKPFPIVHQAAAQFYDRFVNSIKQRIRTAQVKAALAANAELVLGLFSAEEKTKRWSSTLFATQRAPIGVAEYRLLPPKLKAKLPETNQLKKLVAETGEPS